MKTFPHSTCAVMIMLCWVATLQANVPGAEQKKPNIVFILADDLGYGELSAYGQTRYATPNIDRLAREGLLATQHYAGAPICAPSRASLMTGRHTGHVSVRNNFGIRGTKTGLRVPLARSETTVAELLGNAGYRTALIGKWGLGEEGSGSEPWSRGFDFFYGFVNQAHAHNQYPEFLYRNAAKEALPKNFSHKEGVFANDRFTEEALDWMGLNPAKPFFLYLSYTTPHADLKVPGDSIAELKARQEWAGAADASSSSVTFAAMVTRLDRDVGRLLARLKELGLEDNTLVIFTSDNGAHEEDGKDNTFFKASGPLRGIKRDLYEGGMRVPFLARWPGRIVAGRTSKHVATFWDFLPTAAELAGVPVPESAGDGLSYLPDLLGQDGQRQHQHLYWELLIKAQGRQAARVGDWKAVRYGQDAPIEIYNLETDPGETTNEASREPVRVAQFAQLFHEARTDSPDFPLRLPPGLKNSDN